LKVAFTPAVKSTLMNSGTLGKFILYADDDIDDQDMMRELLQQIAPDVQLVSKDNGENLLRFVDELPDDANLPALVILDLNMPGLDGIETLTRLKEIERYKHVPALIFTTAVNDIDKQRAFSSGATAFVNKPSSYKDLQVIIASFASYINE
jgi:CheY-like chemotaxis protein